MAKLLEMIKSFFTFKYQLGTSTRPRRPKTPRQKADDAAEQIKRTSELNRKLKEMGLQTRF